MCGGGGEHRWEVDDGLDEFRRCVECSIWCEKCNRVVEEVDGDGRCEECSRPVKCENCGRRERGRTWFPDYGLDEFGMCSNCTIKCANCNKAVYGYDDDLDDQDLCEDCRNVHL